MLKKIVKKCIYLVIHDRSYFLTLARINKVIFCFSETMSSVTSGIVILSLVIATTRKSINMYP